jgi:FkbM family methyltransferase
MVLPYCPKCRENLVHQSRRQGLIEVLWGFFGFYPFRCQLCTHRFLAFQWWLRRVSRAISFDVYAVCYNEEKLLPAFLHHYRYADKIVVFDNESTDHSRDIVLAAGREVRVFSTGGKLDDETNRMIKNTAWKESRGSADFVIVQDLDEFLHFPKYPGDLRAGLLELRATGCTAAKTFAYDMYCTDSEWDAVQMDQCVVTQITRGKRCTWFDYDKVLVFDPNAITESNYGPGCHHWNPVGKVKMAPDNLRPMMLHFKHLGPAHELERRITLRDRLSELNLARGHGFQYLKTDQAHQAEVAELYSDPQVSDIGQTLLSEPYIITRPFPGISFAVFTFGEGDFISDRLLEGKVWEPRMASAIGTLCHQDMETAFLDLGANLGIHSFTALASGAAKVLSVECHPDTVHRLRRGYLANGWSDDRYQVIYAAASERSGTALRFRQWDGNLGGSRILRPDELSQPADKVVQTVAIDDLPLGIDDCKSVVVKMDIEGHEPEAIRGMKKLLHDPRVKCILIELNPLMRFYQDLLEMVANLRALGFRTARQVLRHPPEEWSGLSVEPMQPFSTSGVWAWIASSYPKLTPDDIESTMREQKVVLEVMMLRL